MDATGDKVIRSVIGFISLTPSPAKLPPPTRGRIAFLYGIET